MPAQFRHMHAQMSPASPHIAAACWLAGSRDFHEPCKANWSIQPNMLEARCAVGSAALVNQ
eukprot:1070211-Pelagomonas_calceolata.AAC.3